MRGEAFMAQNEGERSVGRLESHGNESAQPEGEQRE